MLSTSLTILGGCLIALWIGVLLSIKGILVLVIHLFHGRVCHATLQILSLKFEFS